MLPPPFPSDHFPLSHSVHSSYGQQLSAKRLAGRLRIFFFTGKLANSSLSCLLYIIIEVTGKMSLPFDTGDLPYP